MKHKSFIIETCEKEIAYLQEVLTKCKRQTCAPLNLLYPYDIMQAKIKDLNRRISRFEIIIESLKDED